MIPRLFFVVFPTAAFYLSALLSNDVVCDLQKSMSKHRIYHRVLLYMSSAVASAQMARRFSSFFGCSPWFLAHILNLKSKIKKKNRLIFTTYGEQNLKSLSEIHISKKNDSTFFVADRRWIRRCSHLIISMLNCSKFTCAIPSERGSFQFKATFFYLFKRAIR